MAKLVNDGTKKNIVLNKIQQMVSKLDQIDSDKAVRLTNWLLEKTDYYYKIENNLLFQKYPNKIGRGDIVLVQLGMNIAPELSDDNTGKHFCVVWAQQGTNFIIIPLTKQTQPPSNKLAVPLGVISGMPNGVATYAKLDAIRSVSIRRLYRIQGTTDGKITLSQDLQDNISKLFLKEFVGIDKFTIDKNNLDNV